MFPKPLTAQAETLLDTFRRRHLRLAMAESCTGGLIAACLTDIAGSSDVVDRGFVTYSNEAKTGMLGVPEELLRAHGAVSAEVAGAMAEAALQRSGADVAVSVTGIAGPGGATPAKPVGLVFIATARRGGAPQAHRYRFSGDRTAVRLATVAEAFALLDALAAAEQA
jgi:nicotinamide-nucleotide amidase